MPLWRDLRAARLATPEALLRRFSVRVAPVPILEMARDVEVSLWRQAGVPWAGALRASTTRADIWVSDVIALPMRRWAVAHLLGHLFLHDFSEQYFFYENVEAGNSIRERQADDWAADVLAPRWLLLPVLQSGLTIEALANLFQITRAGMALAMERLRR